MKKNNNKKEEVKKEVKKVDNVELTNKALEKLCKEDNDFEIKGYSHGAKMHSKSNKRSICEVHIGNNSNMVATNKLTSKYEAILKSKENKESKKVVAHYKKSDEKMEHPYYYTINNIKHDEVVEIVKDLREAYKK